MAGAKRKSSEDSGRWTKKSRSSPTYRKSTKGKIEGWSKGKIVSGSSNAELKSYDVQQALTNVTSGGSLVVDLLATLAEGVTDDTRIGQKILIKSVDVILKLGSAVGATYNGLGVAQGFMDVALVWDKQPNGATATAAAIFKYPNNSASFGLESNADRFVVLRREHFTCDAYTGASKEVQWHVPMEMASRFTDATSVPQTNGLMIVGISESAAGTTLITPQCGFVARVKFADP